MFAVPFYLLCISAVGNISPIYDLQVPESCLNRDMEVVLSNGEPDISSVPDSLSGNQKLKNREIPAADSPVGTESRKEIRRYHGRNIYFRIKDWLEHIDDPRPDKNFRFDFVGAPYYAEDVKFAIGLLGSALYKTDPKREMCPMSFANAELQFSTTLYYSATVYGTNYSGTDKMRIKYFFRFQSFPTYFWGTGFDAGLRNIKSNFRELSLKLKSDFLFKASGDFYIGPGIDFKWVERTKVKNQKQLWEGYDRMTYSPGCGIVGEYDTRDIVTEPEKGVYVRLSQMVYPRIIGNGNNGFSSTELNLNGYWRVSKSAILAAQLHTAFTYGRTPWGMMPTFGDGSMRGYYVGRYRDKCEYDMTVEYRQHIWKRSGMVLWAGAGSVAQDPGEFRFKTILPNFGIGYRFRFRKGSNIRVDFGVGRGTYGFEFNINECF